MKSKRFGSNQRHDFTKKLTDQLRDDRCIIGPGVINTKIT
jgi:hypothetical protein